MQNNKQYISMTPYDDFMKDTRKAYLLLKSLQYYINDCIDEYNKLNKDDEQYESDSNYLEKKVHDLLEVWKTLFDIANGLEG
nr:MAG TPA: hypothetical protein [Caudoviricetes sp.]